MLANPRFVQSPAVSVVADAVRSLVATDQPHAYTLLETAREYHSAREAVDERTFQAPAYWTTQLSDQLPGERIFELWNSDTQRFHTPKTQLIENLAWTVKAKHRALQAVVRRLREDLNGQLHREAPQIKHLQPPGSAGAMSYLGSLLVWYSKLNHAINLQETVRVRAMAPHEREARFATIYCEEFLTGDAAKDAAAHLNLSVVPGRRFYKMRPASAEVRAEVGDFTWFASPADNPELVHSSLYWAVREKGLLGEGWWVNKPPYLNSWESVLGVTIAALDRSAGLVALDMSHVDLVDGLVSAGLLDLDGACLVDRVNIDFLSRRIEDVAKAVGNPAVAAQHETELRAALGVATRGPRRTSASRPVHALLWSPASLHGAQVARPVAAIRPKVEAALTLNGAPSLNDDQWDAWAHSMTRRLTLIWGPPGEAPRVS